MLDKKRRINTPFANINYPHVKYDPARYSNYEWRFPYWLRRENEKKNLTESWLGNLQEFLARLHRKMLKSSNLNSQRTLMDVSIESDAVAAIRRCHLWRSSHKEMLIGHHQFPFFFSSFLLRRAFRDVKQIFRRLFYVPTHFDIGNLLRRLHKTRKRVSESSNYANRIPNDEKLAQEASTS